VDILQNIQNPKTAEAISAVFVRYGLQPIVNPKAVELALQDEEMGDQVAAILEQAEEGAVLNFDDGNDSQDDSKETKYPALLGLPLPTVALIALNLVLLALLLKKRNVIK
jgi:hypothetical protein